VNGSGTGLVESWTADPSQLGPIYPFHGSEVVWLALVIGFCVGWTVWQIRTERAEHAVTEREVREASDD
jgi:hypothetical protein